MPIGLADGMLAAVDDTASARIPISPKTRQVGTGKSAMPAAMQPTQVDWIRANLTRSNGNVLVDR